MKRLFLIPLLAITLTLGGCAGTKLGDLYAIATATISNPVDSTDIYRVQNSYAAALALAAEYRKYCYARPYKALMEDPVSKPICERRRAVVRLSQKAKANARKALDLAEEFIANNPTLNAATTIDAAWNAVKAFQNAVPAPSR